VEVYDANGKPESADAPASAPPAGG
jgi:hypothetical protein